MPFHCGESAYHANLDGANRTCECSGFLRWDHCKRPCLRRFFPRRSPFPAVSFGSSHKPVGARRATARLTRRQLETHLWGAANILRGRTAGQDYKTYILSLMPFKRLSDQWDYEADEKIGQVERERGRPFTDAQRNSLRARGDIHRFAVPKDGHWSDVVNVSENIGQVLTQAMRGVANEVVSALVQHFHRSICPTPTSSRTCSAGPTST